MSLRLRQFLTATLCFCSIAVLLGGAALPARAADKWDVLKDIERLRGEAPSLAAFPDASGVVWMRDLSYSLRADGTMEKTRRLLLLVGQELIPSWTRRSFAIPANGASLKVGEAAWYDPIMGKKEGALGVLERTEQGQRYLDVLIPAEAAGRVVAFSLEETHPKRYYLDDVLFLALDLPVWEQRVSVEVPADKELFWLAEGVRAPSVERGQGGDRYVWTVSNQPSRPEPGLLKELPHALIFSLRKGLEAPLLEMEERARSLRAIAMPDSLKPEGVADYFASPARLLDGPVRDLIRPLEAIPQKGPWSPWEQALIAHNWFSSKGWGAKLYWSSILPITDELPGATNLLDRPVIELTPPKGKPFYFYPGQSDAFGKLPSGLHGMTLYHMDKLKGLETRKIPYGSATDHRLVQKWNLALDASGVAEGKLELSVLGGWTDIFSMGRIPSPQAAVEGIRSHMEFRIPGLVLGVPEISPLSTGYVLRFNVRAPLGIAAGGDLLLRMPGGVPMQLENLARVRAGDTLSFPFTLETKVTISTPGGYQALALPPVSKVAEGKVFMEEQVVHWPKKGQLEASSRWIVRAAPVDEALARGLSQTLGLYLRWKNSAVPLRRQK